MRTSTDRLNVSLSNSGSYLFFNEGATLGTYNTDNSWFPWFIELTGYARFNKISYKNEQLDNEIITSNSYNVSLTTKKLTLLAASSNTTVNLATLMPTHCLNNIFEFRVITNISVTFTCSAQAAIMLDMGNSQIRSITFSSIKYIRFYYTYYNNLYTYILLTD